MADDTITTDAPPISESVQYGLDMAKAGLTHDESVQLDVTLAPMIADGTLNENDIYHAQHVAEAAHAGFEDAKAEQHEEKVAADSGNLVAAHEHGVNAGYDLHKVDDNGGASAHPTIEALEDKQDHSNQQLSNAQWEAATAHGYAVDANSNAASGNYDNAVASADTAAAHHDNAVDHATDAVHHDDASSAAPEAAAASETSGETAV
jgi:hypothetical protein